MLVSAISATNQKSAFINSFYYANKYQENSTETAFSALSLPKNSQNNNQTPVYDAINEWKNFCHQQILAGKLDVIA